MIHSVFERCGSVETVSFLFVKTEKKSRERLKVTCLGCFFFFLYIEICHV